MKQNITKEEWAGIGEMAQTRFLERFNLEGQMIGRFSCSTCGNNGLPNVGQMIEFLGESWFNGLFVTTQALMCNTPITRDIIILPAYRVAGYNYVELCDALWESVKIKLLTESK